MEKLQLQIDQNKELLIKALHTYELLMAKHGEDHDETTKQRAQISQLFDKFNILYDKIGNGWSGEVQKNIEELKNRAMDGEKSDIAIRASITALDVKLDSVIKSLQILNDRPKNKRLRVRDTIYFILGGIAIVTAVGNGIFFLISSGGAV